MSATLVTRALLGRQRLKGDCRNVYRRADASLVRRNVKCGGSLIFNDVGGMRRRIHCALDNFTDRSSCYMPKATNSVRWRTERIERLPSASSMRQSRAASTGFALQASAARKRKHHLDFLRSSICAAVCGVPSFNSILNPRPSMARAAGTLKSPARMRIEAGFTGFPAKALAKATASLFS